jgi:hypothetical protein
MVTPIISRTKPRDYRPALYSLARYYAKEEAKARIRAAGRKISHYFPKDITVMANQLLLAEPEPFIARARETIAGWIAKEQRQTVHTLSQSATTSPTTAQVSQ